MTRHTRLVGLSGDAGRDESDIADAAAVLAGGGLVAFPTETVYGLGAVATDVAAVQRVFQAKGRPFHDPLIVHVTGVAMLDTVVDGPNAQFRRLAAAHWPGPLTLIGRRGPAIPPIVTSGKETVAVRAPAHPVAQRLIELTGAPIAAPSANRFGYVSPTTAAHVLADLDGRCDVILDGGPTTRGIESTVVLVADGELIVLRHGALPVEALDVEPGVVVHLEPPTPTYDSASPGRELRHYSPRLRTVASDDLAAVDLDGLGVEPASVVLVGYDDRRPGPTAASFVSLGSTADLDTVAADLYAVLRGLDELPGAQVAVIELTGVAGLGRAIDDRIRRAAAQPN